MAAGVAVTEMNTPIKALTRARRQRWAYRALLTGPLRIPAAYLELHARGMASRNCRCEPQRIGARKRPGGVPPVRE